MLIRSEESFASAREERLKVSGNPSQYDNLQIFIDEQNLFRQVAEKSSLPVLEIDISDKDIELICTDIADWLEKTGGLWAK